MGVMSTFLVTGGCGFIGSHLADALTSAGHHVRILDDLSTGHRHNLPAQAELIVGDVADRAAVGRAMNGVDGCFHLAAIASVERSTHDWLGAHRTNLTGAIAVFDAARASHVPVVYASSAAVYGDSPSVPLSEAAQARPLSSYGADKLGCELHGRVAQHVHRVPTTGLRFFNVYGPRQDPKSPYSGVISIFCDRLLQRRPIVIHGDGEQVRDFVFVGDVVRALQAAMAHRPIEPAVFNVCSGQAISIKALVQAVGAALDLPAHIEFGAARVGDIRASVGDPTMAAATLGFATTTDLRDGLRATIAHLQRVRAA
jgi:UDP-glucose 4-epimerase